MTTKTAYTEKKIREGYSAIDITMWQNLLRAAETELGNSVKQIHAIIDLSVHNDVNVLDIIKSGRIATGEKKVTEKFMRGLYDMLEDAPEQDECPDDDDAGGACTGKEENDNGRCDTWGGVRAKMSSTTKVLDLTAEDSSGSYDEEEHTLEPHNPYPNSSEAYELDGFVVPDSPTDTRCHVMARGLARTNALVGKRKLTAINEED